jgi:hypothetical protein
LAKAGGVAFIFASLAILPVRLHWLPPKSSGKTLPS